MKLLVIDNYDSFTYNLVYILRQNKIDFEVYRNDKITSEQAEKFDGILLSPGPGIPEEAGNMPAIIARCAGKIPILGICLGHQAVSQYLGSNLINRSKVFHGLQTPIRLINNKCSIFNDVPEKFLAGRYHSWEISREGLPDSIEITAIDDANSIMAIQQEELKLFGLQFHPESIMTPDGDTMIKNFIQICKSEK